MTCRCQLLDVEYVISTHTLRKEGDDNSTVFIDRYIISTHTLRKEGDIKRLHLACLVIRISTHTLRKEGDRTLRHLRRLETHFNPHPPQGG